MKHYTTYLYPHGHLIVAPEGLPLTELQRLILGHPEDARLAPGIAHHYRYNKHGGTPCFAFVPNTGAAVAWETEINESLRGRHSEARWFLGTDVGSSSLTMFATLCSPGAYVVYAVALENSKQHPSTPQDSEDLGRCLRLCDALGWHSRIDELATAYPHTHWPAIAAHWKFLRTTDTAQVNDLLKSIHATNPPPRLSPTATDHIVIRNS
ncbi:hypothetical protein UFOVP736_68 [uncultured Caudovirales phage]|uniref:Uncharacterized protein n=1 Tax=uncultured Caudovirales phage TaxID=2100421 RepID=A0A6J5NHZ2_9CAUD|nr:hypothetical protein UFOVP705_13 [uncultured Caudovirales phage]CAB5224393.1 hypothetical protein UFOVP736_68 [uncultured Caudovirales phage]